MSTDDKQRADYLNEAWERLHYRLDRLRDEGLITPYGDSDMPKGKKAGKTVATSDPYASLYDDHDDDPGPPYRTPLDRALADVQAAMSLARRAKEELERAQAEVDRLKAAAIPQPVEGTVIQWSMQFQANSPAYSYAAIRVKDTWHTTGGDKLPWTDFITWLRAAHWVGPLWKVSQIQRIGEVK